MQIGWSSFYKLWITRCFEINCFKKYTVALFNMEIKCFNMSIRLLIHTLSQLWLHTCVVCLEVRTLWIVPRAAPLSVGRPVIETPGVMMDVSSLCEVDSERGCERPTREHGLLLLLIRFGANLPVPRLINTIHTEELETVYATTWLPEYKRRFCCASKQTS